MTKNPNIIMILCDELRADALGCYGNTIIDTPNIDRLATMGTRFDQCMVTQPTCTPSRASILTGCYPSAIRSRMVGCYTPDDTRFLPRILSENGYRTASIGKLHLVPQGAEPDVIASRLESEDGTYYGFREIDLVNGHGDRCFGPQYSKWLNERVPDLAERLERKQPYPDGVNTYTWELPEEVHSSHYIADRTIEFLEQADKQPFFLHVSFPDPHYPFTVPEPYASQYNPDDMPPPIHPINEEDDMPPLHTQVYRRQNTADIHPDGRPVDRVIGTPPHVYSDYTVEDWQQVKAIYYGMVALLDDCIGRILNTIDQLDLMDNTIIVFLSDHGDYLGDHGFYGKGLPYDSVLRVPVIWAGSGIKTAGIIDSVESTLDIASTLLDMISISEPEAMQGKSLKTLLGGENQKRLSVVMTENDDDFAGVRMRTITTKRWRLTYYLNEPFGELIDRENDPNETHNLWNNPEYDSVKQDLFNQLMNEVLASIDMSNGRKQKPSAPIPKWRSIFSQSQ
jgi:arylsulfatase